MLGSLCGLIFFDRPTCDVLGWRLTCAVGCKFYDVEVDVLVCTYYLIQKYAREYMQAFAVFLLTFAKALLFRVVCNTFLHLNVSSFFS